MKLSGLSVSNAATAALFPVLAAVRSLISSGSPLAADAFVVTAQGRILSALTAAACSCHISDIWGKKVQELVRQHRAWVSAPDRGRRHRVAFVIAAVW